MAKWPLRKRHTHIADLTEDKQRAFGDRIVELLGDPDLAAALTAADTGLDSTKRLARITPLKTKATQSENEQTKKKAELRKATDDSQADTANYYREASSAAEAVISALGEEHPSSGQIRSIRSGMSYPAARGSGSGTSTPTP